ncbi:MAG: hypothetical protein RIR26_2325, partial [Pseudomonadota bacterium]
MTGSKRQFISTMLVIFSLHPATGLPQSQKSQIWRVPVLPSERANEGRDTARGALSPDPRYEERFRKKLQTQEMGGLSASEMSVDPSAVEQSVNFGQILSELGLTAVGRESGGWGAGRLSARGHPGREPEVSLEGIPLSSGFTG